MGKLKIKKSDVWIDMTPMSDVMVLLLTFFMLTSTFVKNEPVKVNQPSSVSEIKVPEKDVLNILVDNQGKVFMSMDNQSDMLALIQKVNETSNLGLTGLEMKKFQTDPLWGIRMGSLKGYLSLPQEKMTERSEEHTSELQSRQYLVCRLLLEKKHHTYTTCSSAATPEDSVV